jgi:hypothetical protein
VVYAEASLRKKKKTLKLPAHEEGKMPLSRKREKKKWSVVVESFASYFSPCPSIYLSFCNCTMEWSHLLLLNPLFLFATSSQHQGINILRTKIPYPKTIPVLIIK